jgi:hypothetical protein
MLWWAVVMNKTSSQEGNGFIGESNLTLNSGVKLVKEGNHGYLYNHGNASVQIANKTALCILELCDNNHSLQDIIENLSELYPDIPHSKLEKDVTHFVTDLIKKGVVGFS